ncbi:helix-turn-helix transcriptional regulator [Paenibacillus bouchesdurhonensis]|uniref:hypothetical protein n=1 Tax=Paenibacillus bouchesdurhonensis TaxID=1870990 RepID=UPI001F41B4D0|nr:hypothetical protein [Paenibacillus bouchesdurhonensis]
MRTNTKIDWHRKVEEAILRMMNALDEPLNFRQISKEVYSSPYHFHRKFRELTCENVHECLKRLRMEQGAICRYCAFRLFRRDRPDLGSVDSGMAA